MKNNKPIWTKVYIASLPISFAIATAWERHEFYNLDYDFSLFVLGALISILAGSVWVLLFLGIKKVVDSIVKFVKLKLHEAKELTEYKKQKKQISIASKFISQHSKGIDRDIASLESMRKKAYSNYDLQCTDSFMNLLIAAEPNCNISALVEVLKQQTQQNEAIAALESRFMKLAEKYRDVGDITNYQKYLRIAAGKTNNESDVISEDVIQSQSKAIKYERALHKRNRTTFIGVLILIVCIVAVCVYDFHQISIARTDLDAEMYVDSYIEANKVIGFFPGKNRVIKSAQDNIGWIYYLSYSNSGHELYVSSEDGNYTQKLKGKDLIGRGLQNFGAYSGNYLYFAKEADEGYIGNGIPYVLDMRTNKIHKISISEFIVSYRSKDGHLYMEGEMWDSSRWHFNDSGLNTCYMYKLNGTSYESKIGADDDNYGYVKPLESVKLHNWEIKEGRLDGKEGIIFSNNSNHDSNFIEGKYIYILGYYLSNGN